MKLFFFVCFIVVLAFAGSLIAQEGYLGPKEHEVTVETVKRMADDSPVVLIGKIERSLGDEKYLFTDETGSIIVEIENKLWRGISLDENDTVEITGEVDRDFTKTEIEASNIKKIK